METLALLLASLLESGRRDKPSVNADASINVHIAGHTIDATIKIKPDAAAKPRSASVIRRPAAKYWCYLHGYYSTPDCPDCDHLGDVIIPAGD